MTIQLTQQELDYMQLSRAAGFDLDESVTTAGENEGLYEETLPTGRIILAVHHYLSDKLTIYSVLDAPPPIEITKINNLIENNQLFRSLINN